MPPATITFRRCVIRSLECADEARRLHSRVFFDLVLGADVHENVYVDIQQQIGQEPAGEPLEISPPHGYPGPLNVPLFHGCVEFYYRHVLGAHLLVAGGRSTALLLDGFPLEREMSVQLEVDDDPPFR